MREDLKSNVTHSQSIAPQALAGTLNGTGVDTAGYESAEFVLDVGTQAGTDNTFEFQDSDDDVTYAAVAAADLAGSQPAAITTANDVAVYRAGYKGSKRYLRIACTAHTTGNLPTSGQIVLGNARHAPA